MMPSTTAVVPLANSIAMIGLDHRALADKVKNGRSMVGEGRVKVLG